ncbi:NTP transferase domain-containing protein [Catellatospora sp. KI3]|uniref:molybdenum cofactor guanylyltransferase n=1 Tax=Catellatospora sp. KI3 TaxID=3041620 RepID=UPI00248275A3|nr:NTP transferase domain-containing protein [Catellatospora sp. KI3]MDI1461719.1 NTP transferase domain-containing protein [Catellatospora sp. KI3]
MVLAGGAARRMGGAPKPLLPVGGVPLLARVLAAVRGADPIVVVGPPDLDPLLPPGVLRTREQPPGGGPVAAVAAGLALCPPTGRVLVAGADLPFLTAGGIADLLAVDAPVVMYADEQGRAQHMLSVWRVEALRAAVPEEPAGASMRGLLRDLAPHLAAWTGTGPPPWYDCDTVPDLRAANDLSETEGPDGRRPA